EVGYVPLSAEAYAAARERFAAGTTGSVFAGGSQVGVTIEDLLRREGASDSASAPSEKGGKGERGKGRGLFLAPSPSLPLPHSPFPNRWTSRSSTPSRRWTRSTPGTRPRWTSRPTSSAARRSAPSPPPSAPARCSRS